MVVPGDDETFFNRCNWNKEQYSISKYSVKKLSFRNPLDEILCMVGEFYVDML